MTDLTATHVSAMVPDAAGQFLLNPYGLLFEEVTASNLVKCDFDGKVLGDARYGLNPAGFAIHGAIHRARADATCVAHTHTAAGTVFAALNCDLLPVNQINLIFYDRVAYNDYSFIEHIDECATMVEDLGDKCAMIMRNHGLLTVGRTLAEAFVLIYYLDRTCEIQARPSRPVRTCGCHRGRCARTRREGTGPHIKDEPFGQLDWDALVRRLDVDDASYRT